MSEFKYGDRVVITDKSLQTYGWQGIVNEVDSMESAGNICIDFADSFGYYNANEIAHFAAAQPPAAETGARGEDSGYTELLDELSGRIKGLERENATLQEQLQKKSAQQKMYKHTIELHEEQYNQARDNATLIRRALQKHAPEAWAEVAKQLNQNVNEYDKLMSDASRGREALAELASVRSQLAAAQAARDAAVAFYALMVNIDVLHHIAEDLANDETWEVWGELAHLREVLDGVRKQATEA